MMKTHVNVMEIAMKIVAIVKYDKINNQTLVLTLDGQQHVFADKPFKVISYWCLLNGSSMQGRVDAFKFALNVKQKCCIMVNDEILLMPTTSQQNDECVYINYHALFAYHQLNPQQTALKLFNGKTEIIDFNYRIIDKQFKRSRQYLQYLEKQRGNFRKWIY